MHDIATVFNALAAILMIASFVMKGMIRLRITAIASNVFNFVYAALSLSPIGLIEYGIALPLNVLRLREMLRLVQKVKLASTGDLSMDWLKPFMSRQAASAGEVIFSRGDVADRMYLIGSGRYRLIESGIELGIGQMVGEMGLLTEGNARTQGFECLEAGDLFSISYEHVRELYYQNPEFGFYFLGLTSRRLLANIARLEAELARRPPLPTNPAAVAASEGA
jgi:CRP/FNR family transcriptional regulator, cyclic AMP receptor protein